MSQLTETYRRCLEQQLAQEIAKGGDAFEVTSKIANKALDAMELLRLQESADADDMQRVALHFIHLNLKRLIGK